MVRVILFLTNYDGIRVERKTAEYVVISSFVKKPAQNREKALTETTSVDDRFAIKDVQE